MTSSLLLRMLHTPRMTGALAPSSAGLARAMAALTAGYSNVLELGAGTGAVTQELLARAETQHIEVVEVQATLVKTLEKKYPNLRIWQAPASAVLDAYAPPGPAAIVSSLPFKSLPLPVKQETVNSILSYLENRSASSFIQFTYGLSRPFAVPPMFKWRRVKWIFTNLPPACIWVLIRQAPQDSAQ